MLFGFLSTLPEELGKISTGFCGIKKKRINFLMANMFTLADSTLIRMEFRVNLWKNTGVFIFSFFKSRCVGI